VVGFTVIKPGALAAPSSPIPTAGSGISNTEAIGRVLYTDYVYFFQAAGIVLLIAMIGAIVLTLRHRPGVRRQDLAVQANRERAKAVEVKSVATGQGVTPEELL
jgi:NADH-quinone oxidoreductase subunit J